MPFWDDADFGPYEQGGYTGGTSGAYQYDVPEQNAPAGTPATAQQPAAPQFNLDGSQVHGRAADTHDLNDLVYLASQQPGFDISNTDAAKRTFSTIIQPLLAQQGYSGAQLGGNNADRFTVGGRTIDFVQNSAGQGPRNLQAIEHGVGGPAPQGQAPGGMPAMPAGGGGGYGGGGGGGGSQGLNLGQFDPFVYENWHAPDPFTAPSAQDAQNDPGYQFGMDQGTAAMTNSAAARGLLRSGGTLQDFAKFGNDYASTKYNDVYNRALNTYGTNTGTSFQANQANNAGRLGAFGANTNAALGYGNLNLGYQNSNNAYSLGQGQLALGNRTADQNYALGQGNLALGYQNSNNANGLGWANFGLNQQGQEFNQGYSLADMGLRAAGQMGGYASQYGQQAGNNATGAGNALAAGQVGSANSWVNGLQNAGQAGLNAYGMYQYGQER